jgi:hypothetical protein
MPEPIEAVLIGGRQAGPRRPVRADRTRLGLPQRY